MAVCCGCATRRLAARGPERRAGRPCDARSVASIMMTAMPFAGHVRPVRSVAADRLEDHLAR